MKLSAKRIATLAILLACALIIFIIESLLPPLLPVAPYVKIGLANSVALFVIAVFGARDGFIFVLAKNLLGALFGSWFAFAFNIAGGISSYIVMMLLYKFVFPKVSLISISVAGAVISNISRTVVAVLLMQANALFVQLPVVCAFSIAAGVFVGILSVLLIKYLPEKLTNQE